MRKVQYIPNSSWMQGRPRCENCDAVMWLASIEPDKFCDQKIIVDRLRYPLGAMHDGVPPSDIQTDPGGPVYGNMARS